MHDVKLVDKVADREDVVRLVQENRRELDYLLWQLASGSANRGTHFPGYGFVKDEINNRITYIEYLEYCLGIMDAREYAAIDPEDDLAYERFMQNHFGRA